MFSWCCQYERSSCSKDIWSFSLVMPWNSSIQTTILIPFFRAIVSGRLMISSFDFCASLQEKLKEKSFTGSAPKEKEGDIFRKKFLPASSNSSFLPMLHFMTSVEYFSSLWCHRKWAWPDDAIGFGHVIYLSTLKTPAKLQVGRTSGSWDIVDCILKLMTS